jgi:hypothetical protein
MRIVALSRASDISVVLTEIHDWWMSVEAIAFDRENCLLSVPLRVSPRAEPEKQLTITGAIGMTLRDRERIVFYDINKVKFDVARKVLEFKFGVPLEFEVAVDWADPS